MDTAAFWELVLRGAVAGLLVFHLVHLALAPARTAARISLGLFTLSVLAYLVCSLPPQQAGSVAWLRWPALALCTSTIAWLWLAVRSVFDDHFAFSLPTVGAVTLAVVLGLSAHGAGELVPAGHRTDLKNTHALLMLGFGLATLWEVTRGWQADLVEPRRAARRWVALAIGTYALLVLAIEYALRDREIGRLLPALHLAGIGAITLALALVVARRPLADLLGTQTMSARLAAGPAAAAAPPAAHAAPLTDRDAKLLAALQHSMAKDRAYRREGLSLAALAQTLGSSETALRGLINQHLGYRNFNDFLHDHRLQEATTRLRNEDLPILSIALECGYGSIGPFNRAFKQRQGMTPTEYRAMARVEQRRSMI